VPSPQELESGNEYATWSKIGVSIIGTVDPPGWRKQLPEAGDPKVPGRMSPTN